MPNPSQAELASYWYQAAAHPIGIYLSTNAPARLKSLLYLARTKLRDPRLAKLQIRTAPPGDAEGLGVETSIWIVNPEGENVLAEAEPNPEEAALAALTNGADHG